MDFTAIAAPAVPAQGAAHGRRALPTRALRALFAAFLAVLAFASTPAEAARDPEDADGMAEHPAIARFPGFFLYNSQHHDFNEFRFACKGYGPDGESLGDTKAGKFWYVDFYAKEGTRPPSAVELQRNFDTAFSKAGGVIVHRHRTAGEPQSTVYRVPLGDTSERWVQLDIHNEGQRYQMHIVETAPMVQKVEFSASELADTLKKQGHVALNGIRFDTGQARIQPESQSLLQEIRTLLVQNASLRLSIEGHTDNVGNAKSNVELSTRRAEAVVAYLVGQGISPQRLRASGKGDSLPVADNRTEDGRARNRRVELVRF